ncbi:MAG: response regulator [Marinobacterium sp.]|nr:response regulator [Marinobacterium sp.]
MQHVLIVEDEVKLAQVLAEYLQQAGYATHCLYRGDEVMAWLASHQTSLVVLDLMLPGVDGLELCQQIRQQSGVPILMATARIEEHDRLTGLESGADDYVCKPYSMREMVARVKAILRRTAMPAKPLMPPPTLVQVDDVRMEIRIKGAALELTPVEFRMLSHFSRNPGVVFSRDDLLNAIYTDYRLVSYRTVDSHIKNLRKKLQNHYSESELIRSVYGVGYRFELPEAETTQA